MVASTNVKGGRVSLNNNDHAARLRQIAMVEESVLYVDALLAGADALERVAVLERELAEARKPCPCQERDARIDAAMEEN
jgi:hypothetical protein